MVHPECCFITPLYAGIFFNWNFNLNFSWDFSWGESAGNINLVGNLDDSMLISEILEKTFLENYFLESNCLKLWQLCWLEATKCSIFPTTWYKGKNNISVKFSSAINHRNNSSETLRGNLNNKLAHIKHRKPTSTKELGQYLAGLFEGDGHFSKSSVSICFHEKDKPAADDLMSIFGYGKITKVKNKKAVNWWICSQEGINKFLSLINGNIRTEYKLEQIRRNAGNKLPLNFQQVVNTEPLLKSWWLVGFTDADGCFYIQIVADKSRSDRVRIQYKFSLKDRTILDQLASTFGSTVGTRVHLPSVKNKTKTITYYWSSSTNPTAYKVYLYFHEFSLQSKKWLEFMYWRKALRLFFQDKHKTVEGLKKIEEYKFKMSNLKN